MIRRAHRRAWIGEGQSAPPETALACLDAVPRSRKVHPTGPDPSAPIIALGDGREHALTGYAALRGGK